MQDGGITKTLTLTEIGTSTGIVLTPEMLAYLKVEPGDTLYAVETAGGYLLTTCDPAVAEELQAGREFIKRYRETFTELAK